MTLKVLHCPGHTPGHIVFINQQARLALAGDVLFNGGVGRSDFPRGDMGFIPGNGSMSSFGHERQTNPFLREAPPPR